MIVYLNRRVPLANGKGTALVSAMDYETGDAVPLVPPAGRSYIGVSWAKQYGKWRAQVRKNGKTVWSARFDDLEKAARARDAKALEHYGEFAVLNFPR